MLADSDVDSDDERVLGSTALSASFLSSSSGVISDIRGTPLRTLFRFRARVLPSSSEKVSSKAQRVLATSSMAARCARVRIWQLHLHGYAPVSLG